MKITKLTTIIGIGASIIIFASQGYADVLFAFNEVGGTVTMTSSGSLNTGNLVPSFLPDGWNGWGVQGSKDIDVIGGANTGDITAQFGFSPGTDLSAITNPGGPLTGTYLTVASVTGSKPFATYSGSNDGYVTLEAGIGVVGSDIDIGGIWTPDQNWTWGPGATFASLGLNIGTYTVSDAVTSESITIQVVPEPAALSLIGLVSGGIYFSRRFFAV